MRMELAVKESLVREAGLSDFAIAVNRFLDRSVTLFFLSEAPVDGKSYSSSS